MSQIYLMNSPTGEVPDTTQYLIMANAYNAEMVEELNGKLEMSFRLPKDDEMLSFVGIDSIVFVQYEVDDHKLNDRGVFHVYDIEKAMTYVVIRARSYIYALRYAIVEPFQATSFSDAITKLQANMTVTPFTLPWTFTNVDVTDGRAFEFHSPTNAWALIGDIIKLYGVDAKFVSREVKFYTMAGDDILERIEYGVNLTDFDLKTNASEIYTSVLPYWQDRGKTTFYGQVQDCSNVSTFRYKRTLAVDFTKEFEQQPTTAQLNTAAANYITQNKIGVRVYNLKAGFAAESGSILDQLNLGDRVTVHNNDYDYLEILRVTAITWDILTGHAKNVQLGKIGDSVARIMANQSTGIEELDNNRFSAAPVILGSTTSTAVTEMDMTPGYVSDNFHTFVLVIRNAIRVLASTTIVRAEVPDTTTSQYNDDTNFDIYSNGTAFAGVSGFAKFDLPNWRVKMRVTNGSYEALVYGLR